MIALTSIIPTRIEHQKECLKTWPFSKIVSFNTKEEIGVLQRNFADVTFIETNNTRTFKTEFIALDDFFEYIRNSDENCVILNSDLEIISLPSIIEEYMEHGVIISNRINYDSDSVKMYSEEKWVSGFDAFFIHKKYIDIYPVNDFVLGQCHYDYWIPYKALRNNIPVFITKEKIFLHKHHGNSKAYQNRFWHKTALHFIEIEGMNYTKNETGCWEMNKEVFKLIQSKSGLI